jgi:hypothetical protein
VWTPRVFLPLVSSFATTYAVLIGLGLWAWWRRVRQASVLEWYAALSVLAIALAGREGAWENYFLEAVAMLCVFGGIAVASLRHDARWKWLLPALLVVQLGLFWNEHDPRIATKLFETVRAGNERVGALVQASQGTVIAEDMGLLWKNGKPVEYYSFVYSTLARAGRYDQKWELENLRAGNFPLVILNRGTRFDVDRYGNFTRAFVSALDYGYAVTSEDARFVVYEPRPLQNLGPSTSFGGLFELVGWSLEPRAPGAGADRVLTVVWQAQKNPATRYTTFAHLETRDGSKLAQDDHEPAGGLYPTPLWQAGELVREEYHLRIPATIPPGEYLLRVGWYDTASRDRLGVEGGADFVELRTLTSP